MGVARVQQIAISAACNDLEELFRTHGISRSVSQKLRHELDAPLGSVTMEITEIYSKDAARTAAEIQVARTRLLAVKKSSIERSVHDGLITMQTADREFVNAGRFTLYEISSSILHRETGRDWVAPKKSPKSSSGRLCVFLSFPASRYAVFSETYNQRSTTHAHHGRNRRIPRRTMR